MNPTLQIRPCFDTWQHSFKLGVPMPALDTAKSKSFLNNVDL